MNLFCVPQHTQQVKAVSFLIHNVTLLFLELVYYLLHSQCASINMKEFKKSKYTNWKIAPLHMTLSILFQGKKRIMMMLEFAKLPKLGLSFNSKSYTTFLIRLTCGTLQIFFSFLSNFLQILVMYTSQCGGLKWEKKSLT